MEMSNRLYIKSSAYPVGIRPLARSWSTSFFPVVQWAVLALALLQMEWGQIPLLFDLPRSHP